MLSGHKAPNCSSLTISLLCKRRGSSMMYLYLVVVGLLMMEVGSSGTGDSSSSPTTEEGSTSPTPQSSYTITYITGTGSSYSTTPDSYSTTPDSDSTTPDSHSTTPDRTTEFIYGSTETTTVGNTILDDTEFSGSGSGSGDMPETSIKADNVTILVGDEAILQEECSTIDCKEDVIQKVFNSYINYSFQWESVTEYHQMVSDIECARLCSRVITNTCMGFHYQQQKCALIINKTPT